MINHPPAAPPAATAKTEFGRFVSAKRREADLTQRELAQHLYVTESAVSKWERGLSYPDISLVPLLARTLGVSEGELINASEDHGARSDANDARVYRRSRAALMWSIVTSAGAAVIASLIVNLAVQHTLSWFFVVLFAVAVAFSLIGLPFLVSRHRGWVVLAASLVSLFALLGTTQLLYGGTYLPVAITSVIFAAILLFSPFAVRMVRNPPLPYRVVLVLAIDSVALVVLLLVVLQQTDHLDALVPVALPIAGLCLAFAWTVALVIRYLPARPMVTAAIVVLLSGVFTMITNPVIDAILDGGSPRLPPTHLRVWDVDHISGNVSLLVFLACATVAAALLLAALRRRQR